MAAVCIRTCHHGSAHEDRGMPPAPPLASGNCLFLDLDGTLLDLRDDPASIRADAPLLKLLADCTERLGGALAIISGRPIADLDMCFAPLRLAAAGIHGVERRGANGVTTTLGADTERLHRAAGRLAADMEDM